ncbi:DUF2079 domain-containing protein [Ilumatobacter sp.]|uniref:DUF2079 domain-containing protein n=1 Tax=Ilumatobacter sp. TaxID=1967498 RepID=UPI003B51D0DA
MTTDATRTPSPRVVDEPRADPSASGRRARERRRGQVARWAPRFAMATIVVAYVVWFTVRSLDNHHALGTATYDSALYDQGIWLLSRFDAPFVTLMGRNLFGDHTSFVLLALVPLYWVWPSAGVLFGAQALAIGLGAVPVFLVARRRIGEWAGVVLGSTYLLHPAVGWTNLENFHPDAFLAPFVGLALWAALERRWRIYVVFVVLALAVKEDASLVIVPLGVWVSLARDRRMGVATVAGSVLFALVATFVVMRGLNGVPTRNGWRIPFGGPLGVIDTAVTNPTDLVAYLSDGGRPWYLLQMTAPFAWAFLRRPAVAAISAVVLFTNVLSTFPYQHRIEFHYGLVAVPALAIATALAIGAIGRPLDGRPPGVASAGADGRSQGATTRALAIVVVAAATFVTSVLWSPVPWGRSPQFHGDPAQPRAAAARELMALIPADAVVSAHYRLTPHLAHRREIYQFPTPFRTVLYGTGGDEDGGRMSERSERVEFVVLPAAARDHPVADWELVAPAFTLVEANEHWRLWRRDPDVRLPAERPPGS